MLEHPGRKITHDGLGLDMEVTKHFVRSPASDEADQVGIDVSAEESHCTRGPEGPGRNVMRRETKLRAEQRARKPEGFGDVGRLDW